MMKEGILRFGSVILVVFLAICSAACVAPPSSGNQTSIFWGSGSGQVTTTTTSETPEYVTLVTPYGWTPPPTSVPVTTKAAEDWVHIYSVDQNFTYEKTVAVAYDLKNPPMVVNFSVKPVNVTRNITVTEHYGTNIETERTYQVSQFHPLAYFEVTVRNRSDGQIVFQDGYSNSNAGGRQYSADLNQTYKITKYGDLLVELRGNWVNVNLTMQVEREGNINSTDSAYI